MQENLPKPARLVQIEPRATSTSTETPTPTINLPVLMDRQVYKLKAEIGFRKIVGLLYTKHSFGAIRRYILSKVLPDKILYRWQPYKRGACNRCGLCCKIIFRCPLYADNGETTACTVYTHPKHFPPACVVFPIDPWDLAEVQREIAPAPCPFYFEGQPEHPTTWGAVKAEIRSELGKRVDKLKEAFDF
jgi:hypothetical protein